MMQRLIIFICLTSLLQSCSWEYYAYILNRTDKVVKINVNLKNLDQLARLPNKVHLSPTIVKFKWGFRSTFIETQRVEWTDSSNFSIDLKPNHTIFKRND